MKEKAVFDAYDSEAKTPLVVPRVKGPMSDKKGTYTLTLESWSPWMEGDPKLDFSKYPVVVYVPKDYDGSTHYGLIISMVYLTGFSWGGRLTGEIVPRQPRIFTGGIAFGGRFTSPTGGRIIPSYPYARKHVVMVLDTGDWDYNRQETYNGYETFPTLGYAAYFFSRSLRKRIPEYQGITSKGR